MSLLFVLLLAACPTPQDEAFCDTKCAAIGAWRAEAGVYTGGVRCVCLFSVSRP